MYTVVSEFSSYAGSSLYLLAMYRLTNKTFSVTVKKTKKRKKYLPFMMTGKQVFITEFIKQLIKNKNIFY